MHYLLSLLPQSRYQSSMQGIRPQTRTRLIDFLYWGFKRRYNDVELTNEY